MYSRSTRPRYERPHTDPAEYPYKRHPAPESLPPNYGGSVFDDTPTAENDLRDFSDERPAPVRMCDECGEQPRPRAGFGKLQDDDVLLIGLIILLITSGADDDVIIMLAFLLLCTMRQ